VCLSHTIYRIAANVCSPKPPPPFIPSFEQLRIARRDRDAEINSRLRGPPLPDSLTLEEDAEVWRALKKRGVIAKVARLQVTDSDLCRLKPGTWLNDEIINFYGQLILERSEMHPVNKGVKNGARSEKSTTLNVHYFNSFFFEKLSQEGYEKARLAKWTKKVRYLPVPH
jgi:sentrin-specific protease 1